MPNSSNYLIKVFDVMPLPCLILSANGLHFTVHAANNAFQLIYDSVKTKLIGSNLTNLFADASTEQNNSFSSIINSINTVIATKEVHTITDIALNFCQAKKAIEYWSVTHSPILDENEQVVFILQSFTNTTATTTVQKEVQEDTSVLQKNAIDRIKSNQAAIIDSTDDIIFAIDKNFRLVTINTSYQQLLYAITGRLEQEGDEVFTGRLGKELTEKWKGYFERAFSGEKFIIQESLYNPFKGYKQYGLINFNPVYGANGDVESVACFAKDITASTLSYLELEKSKNELDKIFSASLDVICTIDNNDTFIKVSPASLYVWGYLPEEMIGRSIFEFIHPDYVPATQVAVNQIKESNTTTNFENKYIKKDGTIATIEWNASWDAKEQIRYGVARDITEKKKNETALIESNLRYNYVTKATSDAIYDWNLEKNVLFVSDIFTDVFGWTIDQIEAQSTDWPKLIHPEDRDAIVKSIREDVTGNATKWRYEYRFLKPDGQYIHVVDKAFIIRNTSGVAVRIVGSKRDVTKRREEILRLKLLESVITNTNDAVVISEAESYDVSGPRIVYVNEAYTKLTGYLANEIIGKTPRILQGPKTDVKELARLKRYMENSEPCEITLINYKKTGEEYWVNFTVTPVANQQGKVTHWVSLQRDITEKILEEKNLTKAIIKAQEDERYELGGELHDNVCQILTSSKLMLKLLRKHLQTEQANTLNEAIDLISLASSEIRNLSHRLAPSFFTDTTIEEAFTNLVRTFNIDHQYQISIHFDEAFKEQPARREFQLNIYRILQEQLKNILKHAQASIIQVTGTVDNNILKLTVTDNGVGFNTNQVKSGIGLANMKRRAELFSGKFNIQSAINKGCIVTVEVPAKEII